MEILFLIIVLLLIGLFFISFALFIRRLRGPADKTRILYAKR